MSYKTSLKNWEGLAKRDPLWSILTNPNKKGNRWEPDLFFETGQIEVKALWSILVELDALPLDTTTALDFGCGIGRLTRALSGYFDQVIGVDAAPTMVIEAKNMHQAYGEKLRFLHNVDPSMPILDDASLDFVLSVIVLQHIPTSQSKQFLSSFLKKLKSGGVLLVQLPSADLRRPSILQRIKSKIKIRERLAQIGIGQGFHMSMHCVTEDEVQKICLAGQATIVSTLYTNHTDPAYNGNLRLMKKEESVDFVSNLYIIKKD